MNAPGLKPLDATPRARGSEAGRGVSEVGRGAGSRAATLADRAIAACLDYEHWASEVARLTVAIREAKCPNESEPESETHWRGSPSCFHEASQDEIGGGYYDRHREGEIVSGRPLTLDEIAERVADCAECSRLVVLIRGRRHARRQLGAAKRKVRRVGRRAMQEAA